MLDHLRYHLIKGVLLSDKHSADDAERIAVRFATLVPMNLMGFDDWSAEYNQPEKTAEQEQVLADLAVVERYPELRLPTIRLTMHDLRELKQVLLMQGFVAGGCFWLTDINGATYAHGTGGCPVGEPGEPGQAGDESLMEWEPAKGEYWQHYKGDLYVIDTLTNTNSEKGWPSQVVYHKLHNKTTYSRPLHEFMRKFVFVRPASLLDAELISRNAGSFENLLTSLIEVTNTNVTKDELVVSPADEVMPYLKPWLIHEADPYPAVVKNVAAMQIATFGAGAPLAAYITAVEFDHSKAEHGTRSKDDLTVQLVITTLNHQLASVFPLTTYTFAEHGSLSNNKDSCCHGIVDGHGREIFAHYHEIRAAALSMITYLARRDVNAPDAVPTQSAAVWLLAGLRAGVMYDHRNNSAVDIQSVITELKESK